MEDKTSSKLKSMLDSKKIRNIIIVVGLIGIGLIFLSNWVDFGSLTSGKGDEAFSVKTYSTKIENDLQTVISKIEGAGKTEVLLTMENSVEYVYLDNSTTKTKEIEVLAFKIPSRLPRFSMCARPMLVITQISGWLMDASSCISPKWSIPISRTATSCSSVRLKMVSGSPIPLLKFPSVLRTLYFRERTEAIVSLVLVLPTLPVMPTTLMSSCMR